MAKDRLAGYPLDGRGEPMPILTEVVGVLNVVLNADTFVPVQIPSATVGKALIIKSRGDFPVFISDTAVGTAYYSVKGAFSLDMLFLAGQILFYAKGSAADTLEVILFD